MSDRFAKEGLSFDDVLLVPRRSSVLPKEADTSTRLARDIRLNIPIISAPMDQVTESTLAISVAREGGMGVIHRNMPVADQAREVDRVKRSESGMIIDPVTLSPDALISEALDQMRHYRISGLPITQDGKLIGILTNRDLRFETRLDRLVSEAMTSVDLVTAPIGTTLEQAQKVLHEHRIEKLPVVDDEMNLKGLITIKDIEKIQKYPMASKDHLGRLRVGAAIGAGDEALERAAALVDAGVDAIFMDTSHAHSEGVLKTLERVREAQPDVALVGGNVGTREAAADVISVGVDAVKVGIGPGSICTTRIVTGAGVPQITAIVDSAEAAAERNIPVIADGGIKYSGDITKAIAAGSDCVMVGSLLAGTEESPGDTVLYMGRTYKEYRGMGSLGAMSERATVRDRYFQEHVETEAKLVPEGIKGRVPYKGPVAAVVHQLVGGLAAGMGFCGCGTIGELMEHAQFIRISAAGLAESHPHGVAITEEPPNYQVPR
ncbi:MAG TPA: IMP dehydrogenase [Armatimonadota bacterium]|nr:IMP dehydrogenase [Armatimonadota bacterium]